MPTAQRPSILSAWDLAAAGGMLALAGYYQWVLPRLPDPVPTHFDALGHANGWTAKADLPYVVFGLALMLWLGLLLVGAVTALAPPRADGAPAVRIQPLRGLLGLGMAVLMGSCLSIPLYGLRCLVLGVVVMFLCLGVGTAFLIRDSLCGLAKVRASGNAGGAEFYRYGIFYVNPDDPRLWVEKRIGVGWTLNFAKPAAYWVLLALLSPVFLAVGLGFLTRH